MKSSSRAWICLTVALVAATESFGGYVRGELLAEYRFDRPDVLTADGAKCCGDVKWIPGGGKSGDGAVQCTAVGPATTAMFCLPTEARKVLGIVQIEADVKGVCLEAGEHPWNGPKLMFPHVNGRGPNYPEMPKEFGSYDWKTKVMVFEFTPETKDLRLSLGVEAAKGELWIDAVRFYRAVEKDDKTPEPAPVNELAATIPRGPFKGRHNPEAYRGVMSGADMSTEAIDTLRSWNANLIRLQIGIETKDQATLEDWFTALEAKLDWAETILDRCRERGMKVVLDLHGGPGCVATKHASNIIPADYDPEPLKEAWRRIAGRFKNRPEVYGYDILNEPSVNLAQWDDLFLVVTREIRAIDAKTPVITEFCHRYFEGENVIYSPHFYSPHSYTHAGVVSSGGVRWSYPGYIDGVYWNADQMRVDLEPWIRFSLAHPDARILVGEFSAILWAKGAGNYIRDAISVFEEYGWDWTYHAFREWAAWDVEYTHVGDFEIGKWKKAETDTPRKLALLDGLSHNRRAAAHEAVIRKVEE